MPHTELSPSLMDAYHKPCLVLGGGSAEISFGHAWGAQAAARSGGCGGLKHGVGTVSGPTLAALKLQANPITSLCPNFPSEHTSLSLDLLMLENTQAVAAELPNPCSGTLW